MKKLIEDFSSNIEDGLKIASEIKLNPLVGEIHEIVICGMGGSGIGGRIVAMWLQSEMKYPVFSVHDYNLPAFVDKNTLVIASSYSGNTEETLICIEKAHENGARIIGITSGGKLEKYCGQKGEDCIIVPGGNPPRSALAFSLIQLVAIFTKLNFIGENSLKQFVSAKELIDQEKENIHNEALALAKEINNKQCVFYTSALYEGIAVRAKQQLNENAKLLCWHHVIPEMNHNELVGWGGGNDNYAAIFLDTQDWIPRNKKRFEISLEVIRKKTKNVFVVEAKGNNKIEKSIYLIHFVDWLSWYLSEMNNTDAMEIKVIDYLKNELSNFK